MLTEASEVVKHFNREELFLSQAYKLAKTSKDPSNQNGALIIDPFTNKILGIGSNNFPQGVQFTDDRALQRPLKYQYFEHAERWAIYDAAKHGKCLTGASMYSPWAACCDCARGIILSGIKELLVHKERMDLTPDRWSEDVKRALTILDEGGVVVRYFQGSVQAPSIIVNGEKWSPSLLKFID